MLKFQLSVSNDKQFAKIEFEPDGESASNLTARDIEQLISTLSDIRAQMVPRVSQSKPEYHSAMFRVDAVSPLAQVVELESGHMLLSMAYLGLGWRTAQLDPDEAAALARLLA